MNCKTSPRRTGWVSRCHPSHFPVYAHPEHYGLRRLWGHLWLLFFDSQNFPYIDFQIPISHNRKSKQSWYQRGELRWSQTKEKERERETPNVSKRPHLMREVCSWDGLRELAADWQILCSPFPVVFTALVVSQGLSWNSHFLLPVPNLTAKSSISLWTNRCA